jgi:hypothetical protein
VLTKGKQAHGAPAYHDHAQALITLTVPSATSPGKFSWSASRGNRTIGKDQGKRRALVFRASYFTPPIVQRHDLGDKIETDPGAWDSFRRACAEKTFGNKAQFIGRNADATVLDADGEASAI